MSLTRINGNTAPMIETGRVITFLTINSVGIETYSGNVGSNLELIVRALETVSSVELIGTPVSGNVRVGVTGADGLTVSTGYYSFQGICNAAVVGATVSSFVL